MTKRAAPGRRERGKSGPPPLQETLKHLLNEPIRLQQDGGTRDIPAKDAMELTVFRQAMEGKHRAMKRVAGWIKKRERFFAARSGKPAVQGTGQQVDVVLVPDPHNAEEALRHLGIIEEQPETGDQLRPVLADWAVELAVARLPRSDLKRLGPKDNRLLAVQDKGIFERTGGVDHD